VWKSAYLLKSNYFEITDRYLKSGETGSVIDERSSSEALSIPASPAEL
jgi:hypothetical protein